MASADKHSFCNRASRVKLTISQLILVKIVSKLLDGTRKISLAMYSLSSYIVGSAWEYLSIHGGMSINSSLGAGRSMLNSISNRF